MKVLVSVALPISFLLIYLNFRRIMEILIVMPSVPFALVGVAVETGVVMLIYLHHAWEEVKEKRRVPGHEPTAGDLYCAVIWGAAARVRPKMMTFALP